MQGELGPWVGAVRIKDMRHPCVCLCFILLL